MLVPVAVHNTEGPSLVLLGVPGHGAGHWQGGGIQLPKEKLQWLRGDITKWQQQEREFAVNSARKNYFKTIGLNFWVGLISYFLILLSGQPYTILSTGTMDGQDIWGSGWAPVFQHHISLHFLYIYRYYWLGSVEDVKQFCRNCDKCQRVNR